MLQQRLSNRSTVRKDPPSWADLAMDFLATAVRGGMAIGEVAWNMVDGSCVIFYFTSHLSSSWIRVVMLGPANLSREKST